MKRVQIVCFIQFLFYILNIKLACTTGLEIVLTEVIQLYHFLYRNTAVRSEPHWWIVIPVKKLADKSSLELLYVDCGKFLVGDFDLLGSKR